MPEASPSHGRSSGRRSRRPGSGFRTSPATGRGRSAGLSEASREARMDSVGCTEWSGAVWRSLALGV